ncbi:cupin domain-containing protein [Pseudomonas segetis]|uniref:Cupin domain-containing protein n=1 Tax=Pseudomonas segetis TaxID=298908 RepID=A0A239IY05_9PSED|nr:cupin domain-containing protein [Pseudomonas segetis]SNS98501.1 Cupin domain-containing protein [Pseudomonas segetis]
MDDNKFPKPTVKLNDDEISTELASINMQDIVVPGYGAPLLERRMRCRLLECHPGGTIVLHSHENRPALLYVLEGSGEEHSNKSKDTVIWKAGDCFAEYNDTEHWIKNLSVNAPLKVLTFDLYDDGAHGASHPDYKPCKNGC